MDPVRVLSDAANNLLEGTEQVIKKELLDGGDKVPDMAAALGEGSVVAGASAAMQTSGPSASMVPPDATIGSTDDFYSCSMQVGPGDDNMQKMIRLSNHTFGTQTIGHIFGWVDLPDTFFLGDDTKPLSGQTKYFRFVRCGYKFMIVVNAPRGASGGILAFFAPPGHNPLPFGQEAIYDYRTMLNFPHVIIDISKSSQASIAVPYINFESYIDYTGTRYNARVYLMTLAPYTSPNSAVNEVNVSIYGEIIDLDLQCPRPYNQGPKLRKPPVPPKPAMKVPSIVIKPGPGAALLGNSSLICTADTLAIAGDASSVDYVTAGANAAVPSLKTIARKWTIMSFTAPTASPQVEWTVNHGIGHVLARVNLTKDHLGTLGIIMDKFQYWRGSLEVRVVFFASTFNQGKYQVSWFPGPHPVEPTLEQSRNALYATADVDGSPAYLKLPFVHTNWRMDTSTPNGTLVIHVVNKLMNNPACTNTVRGIVLIRAGSDFEAYAPCYGMERITPTSQGITDQIDEPEESVFVNFQTPYVAIQTDSHMDVKNFFGRSVHFVAIEHRNTIYTQRLIPPSDGTLALLRFFSYWTGEIVLTLANKGSAIAYAAHSYSLEAAENFTALTSMGAVAIPANGIKNVVIPYYSETPFRNLYRGNSFGALFVATGGGQLEVYLSLRNPSFFVPAAFPKHRATATISDLRVADRVKQLEERPLMGAALPARLIHDRKKLLRCGDIETNPGPYTLVKRDRGVYSHYGITDGKIVYSMGTENPMTTITTGRLDLVIEDLDDTWVKVDKQEVDFDMMLHILTLNDQHYSIDWNCETWARLNFDGLNEQGTNLKIALTGLMILTGCFLVSQGPDFASKFVSLLTDRVFASLENEIVKLVLRTITRIVCYLIMYAHAPNLLTTGALAVLLALDATGPSMDKKVLALVKSLTEGNFTSFCESLIENVDGDKSKLKKTIPKFSPVTTQPSSSCCPFSCCTFVSQSPKDFNEWSNMGKNVKWWIEQIMLIFNWIKTKLFPQEAQTALSWLEENETLVALTIARADEYLLNYNADKTACFSQDMQDKCRLLVDKLNGICFALNSAGDRSGLVHKLNQLIGRLTSLKFDTRPQWKFRMEPYGIWISGAPGVGKSFFCHFIAKAIADRYGWKIYSNPSGSEHMDGYLDQEIHLFDDLGQIRDENDLKLICNLISSIPFIVPKADLESKGTMYNGKLVIATTNKPDFTSTVLMDSDALKRRFTAQYQIRPRPQYELNGKLNLTMASDAGALASGNMWQCWQSGLWLDVDMPKLIDGVCAQIDARLRMVKMVSQNPPQTPQQKLYQSMKDLDDLFDDMDATFADLQLRIDTLMPVAQQFQDSKETLSLSGRIKKKLGEIIANIKSFIDRNRAWFLVAGAIGTISSLAFMAWELYHRATVDESAYAGKAQIPKKTFINRLTKQTSQSPQLDHIASRLVLVDGPSGVGTGVAIGGKKVMTYGHGRFDKLVQFKDKPYNVPLDAVHLLADGQPQDIQILTPANDKDLDVQFKQLDSLIHDKDYEGDGVLLWKTGSGYFVRDVSRIHTVPSVTTLQNVTTTYAYSYFVPNHVGMCGGLLVGFPNGNPKILGIHVAGNGTLATAARIFPTFCQGLVTQVQPAGKPLYHLNTRTRFKKSPLHDVLPGDSEPAVLSKFDQRLKNPVDDVVKLAAQKYRVNHFNVPEDMMRQAIVNVQNRIFSVVGNCRFLTYEEAKDTTKLTIDWSTSPGLKYAGRSKHDLIDDEDFKQDVAKCIENPSVQFVTHLKDELRPKSKVEIGKTRAIEAAPFDYVMAARMVTGDFFLKIYQDDYCRSGLAVGINPYTMFCSLWDQLEDYNVCVDYSGFDGSLSPQLMEHARDIIAYHYDDPEKVKKMIDQTIYSTNYVYDEIWTVEGGMCSGSPYTTILNSICGLLVAEVVYLNYGLTGKVFVYGDDAIWSTSTTPDISDVAQVIKDAFGMVVTDAYKREAIGYCLKEEVSFLKRRFVQWKSLVTGALDPQNIMDHLRWCKSIGTFDDQIFMACIEMALNGQEQYEKFYQQVSPHYQIMRWQQIELVVDSIVLG